MDRRPKWNVAAAFILWGEHAGRMARQHGRMGRQFGLGCVFGYLMWTCVLRAFEAVVNGESF